MDPAREDVGTSRRHDGHALSTSVLDAAESGATSTLARYYETAVFDTHGTEAAVRIICLPATPEQRLKHLIDATVVPQHELEKAADALGLKVQYGVGADQLIGAILATHPDPGVVASGWELTTNQVYERLAEFPELIRFAARVALDPIVLVERSPARASSIVDLVRRGGTSAAVVSAVAAHQGVDPMLLIYTSGSVILVGSAIGLARGMEAGMENVGFSLAAGIRRWIDPSSKQADAAELAHGGAGAELSEAEIEPED